MPDECLGGVDESFRGNGIVADASLWHGSAMEDDVAVDEAFWKSAGSNPGNGRTILFPVS